MNVPTPQQIDVARLFDVPLHLLFDLPSWWRRRSKHPRHGFSGDKHRDTPKWKRRYYHR